MTNTFLSLFTTGQSVGHIELDAFPGSQILAPLCILNLEALILKFWITIPHQVFVPYFAEDLPPVIPLVDFPRVDFPTRVDAEMPRPPSWDALRWGPSRVSSPERASPVDPSRRHCHRKIPRYRETEKHATFNETLWKNNEEYMDHLHYPHIHVKKSLCRHHMSIYFKLAILIVQGGAP